MVSHLKVKICRQNQINQIIIEKYLRVMVLSNKIWENLWKIKFFK